MICSTVVHDGGGLPLAAEPWFRRIIGFCGLPTHTVSYATTHAITPPFWAHKAAVSCGVPGCCRKWTSEKSLGVESKSFEAITWGSIAASATLKQQQ